MATRRKSIFWTPAEWGRVSAEFTRLVNLAASADEKVSQAWLVAKAQDVIPSERRRLNLNPSEVHRTYWTLKTEGWKVRFPSAKTATSAELVEPVKAVVWPVEPVQTLTSKPANDLSALLKNLEAINVEIAAKQQEDEKTRQALDSLQAENQALKTQLAAAKKIDPVAESILCVVNHLANSQEDLYKRLTAYLDVKLAEFQVQQGLKLVPAPAPGPALASVGADGAIHVSAEILGFNKTPKHNPSPTSSPRPKKTVLIAGLTANMLPYYAKELPGVDITLVHPDKIRTNATPGQFDMVLLVTNGVVNHKAQDYLIKNYGRDKVQFIKKGQQRIVEAVKNHMMMA